MVLRRRGLAPSYVPPISVVLAGARDRYIAGLTYSRDDRIGEWIEQFAAAAATGRSKPPIYQALQELESAGILMPLSESRRNRSWEAVGLLDLLAGLEAGRLP